MYCKNCNQMIPDGSSFCINCGAPQNAPAPQQPVNPTPQQPVNPAPQQTPPAYQQAYNPGYQQPVNSAPQQTPPAYQQAYNPGYQQPVNSAYQQTPPAFQQPVPAKKKKGMRVIIALAVIGVIVLLIAIISGFGNSGSDSTNSGSNNNSEESIPAVEVEQDITFSAEFQQILDDNELEFTPYDFDGLSYTVYASEDSDGMLDIQEFGYRGNKIIEMREVIAVPTADYDASDIPALEEAMKEEFADYENLSFCTMDYYEIEDFYVVEIYLYNLDSVANLKQLQALDFVESGEIDYLSLSITVDGLTSSGYVKGY